MENTMLIVDDVEMNREILKVLFHSTYEIMEAEDGAEALEVLERCEGNIDIVLLDLMMPELSGLELLERRQSLNFFKNVPVVIITSSEHMQDQIRAFEIGANDYINKPFVPEIVISRVNNVMASHRRMLSVELEAQKLKVKSELDEMTGIYNKTTTELVIEEVLKTSPNQLNVLMIIDIDNFKTVNDTAGHQAGDHVIKIIADLISSLFRKSDVVGRIGGDEFVAMMVDIPSMDIAYEKINELIQIMRYKPNLTIPQYVTLSIGVANNERKLVLYHDLFKKADEALYQAKQGGKAQYREYGVEPLSLDNDKRPAVLLLGNNRSVCSIIHALVPSQLRIVEALEVEDLDKIEERERSKIVLAYVDVSDRDDDGAAFWNQVEQEKWFDWNIVFAVCKEGSLPQYMEALKRGVGDMVTAPIDTSAFKRRTMEQLEKLGVTQERT